MALGLNPVGDVLKKADRVLANAGDTLGTVGDTLATVDTKLANVDKTLGKGTDAACAQRMPAGGRPANRASSTPRPTRPARPRPPQAHPRPRQ